MSPRLETCFPSEMVRFCPNHCFSSERGIMNRPMKNTISGNEARGFMKIIVDADTDTVIGVHMIGPESAEILQVQQSLSSIAESAA